jgi:ABC-type Fe3+-hydroxamate transport system substrate-binding protein
MPVAGSSPRRRFDPFDSGGFPLKLAITTAAALVLYAVAGSQAPGSGADQAGSVRPPAPQRIIAAAPSNVEIICALGAADRLVGVSSFASYPESVLSLPKVGGIHDPDLETILALKPDLVVLRGRNAQVVELCAENGIRLYVDQTDTLPSLFITINELGALLHVDNEARELTESLQGRLDAIRRAAEGRARPRVLLSLRSLDRLASVTTVARGSYLDAIIKLAGGENIFGEMDMAYPEVSLEEILARKPDIVLEAMPGEELEESQRQDTLEQWRRVGVFQGDPAGHVHFLTEDHVLIPSPRVGLLAERLERIFSDWARLNKDAERDN